LRLQYPVIEDRLAGEEAVMKSTAKRKIMAHPFFNEKTDGELSIKMIRQLSDR